MSTVTIESARKFCEFAQQITVNDGVFHTKDLPREPGYRAFLTVSQHSGFVKQSKKGTYRWIGPETVTVVTAEKLFQDYRQYNRDHCGGYKRKTNGAAQVESGGSIRAQIAELTAQVAQCRGDSIALDEQRTRLDALEKTVLALIDEIG